MGNTTFFVLIIFIVLLKIDFNDQTILIHKTVSDDNSEPKNFDFESKILCNPLVVVVDDLFMRIKKIVVKL